MSVKKALLCDDDKTTTMILKHLLTPLQLTVSVAQNGKEGLEMFESEKPDLLILDLDMPILNGMSVLHELQIRGESGAYIILMSSHEGATDHKLAKDLGANEVFIKPFKPAELVGRIANLMKDGKI